MERNGEDAHAFPCTRFQRTPSLLLRTLTTQSSTPGPAFGLKFPPAPGNRPVASQRQSWGASQLVSATPNSGLHVRATVKPEDGVGRVQGCAAEQEECEPAGQGDPRANSACHTPWLCLGSLREPQFLQL